MESKRGMFSDIEFLNTPYNKNGAFNAFENTLNTQDGMVLYYNNNSDTEFLGDPFNQNCVF